MRGRKPHDRLENGTFAPGVMCKNGHLLSETAYFSRTVPGRWSCKECNNIWNNKNKDRVAKMRRKWRVNNNDKEKAAALKRYNKDPEKFRQIQKDYYIKSKPMVRRKALEKKYNTTKEKIDEMFLQQGNSCAICGTNDFLGRVPNVDHCHVSGKVRGLLCFNCNTGLGNFKDDPLLLTKAINYLSKISLDK